MSTEPPGPRFRLWALVTFLRRDLPPERMRRLARRFPRLCSLGFGPQKVYLVSHPDLVRQLLVGSSRSVEKGPALRAAGLVLGEGLLTLPGAQHKPRRRLVNPAFHHGLMAGYAETMVSAADELDTAWRALPEGAVVDMAEQMSALTLQVVGRAIFGAELGGSAGEVYRDLERALAGWEKLMSPVAPCSWTAGCRRSGGCARPPTGSTGWSAASSSARARSPGTTWSAGCSRPGSTGRRCRPRRCATRR